MARKKRGQRLRAFRQAIWGEADRRVRVGRWLGLLFIAGGFVVLYFAWSGAAELVRVDSQFPYLLSGGFVGLGMIVLGATLLFLSTVRAERQVLTEKFDEMSKLLLRNLTTLQFSSNGQSTDGRVVAGGSTYHRVECTVLEGKSNLMTIPLDQAAAEGLTPCRVCKPPLPESASEQQSVT
jgi:hypothetical protein